MYLNKTNIIFNSVDDLGKTIQSKGEYDKVFVLVDENTKETCFPLLLQNQDYFNRAEIIEIPAGEESKSLDIAYQIWGTLLELGASKKSLLVNLGGGVVTDLGGFIASTFKRGIPFVNVPTSLMGQVDAAIGGKTGINFESIKNQIGTFSSPLFVFIDEQFLNTLPSRESTSGLAEIIKYGAILDTHIFDLIEKDWQNNLHQLIKNSALLKQEVVEQDFTEKGERKKLNFGHTIGHALETLFEGKLTHGEAVAHGMVLEAKLSQKYTGFSVTHYNRLKALVEQNYGKLHITKAQVPAIINLMKHDKKNEGGKINFTLLEKIGTSKINCYCKESDIEEAILLYLK